MAYLNNQLRSSGSKFIEKERKNDCPDNCEKFYAQ